MLVELCLISTFFQDLDCRQNPVMCDVCWEVLKIAYRFLARCKLIDSKVIQFCRVQKIATIGVTDLKKFIECNSNFPKMFNDILPLEVYKDVMLNRSNMKSNPAVHDIFCEITAEMEEQAIRAVVKIEDESDMDADPLVNNVPNEFVPVQELCRAVLNDTVIVKQEEVSGGEDAECALDYSDVNAKESCTGDVEDSEVRKKLYVNLERISVGKKKPTLSRARKNRY